MQVIGSVSKAQLLELAKRGLTPKQALDALTEEARKRHPGFHSIVLQSNTDGFNIVAV